MNLINQLILSSRKVFLPTKLTGLIIDVGSGGNPHLWADVTTDMYEDNEQRFSDVKFKGLFVWSNAEKLPFRDKIFDYSISSHVLEHTPYPEKMIVELERISKAGYIETPPICMELVSPYNMHYSRVTQVNNKIIFKLKSRPDEKLPKELVDLQLFLEEFQKFSRKNLTPFRVNKLYWKHKIDFEVIRDENYVPFEIKLDVESGKEGRTFYSEIIIKLLEFLFQLRLKRVDILDVCVCPNCKGDLKKLSQDLLICIDESCNRSYPRYKGFFDFRDC